jgi:hypothetical protein
MAIELPDIIAAFQGAHDQHDTEAAVATFVADATVVDDGRTYTGTTEIRAWLDRASSEYTYTRSLTGVDDHGDGTFTVSNHLEGDFPGGQVDLLYRFEVEGDLTRLLHIAP